MIARATTKKRRVGSGVDKRKKQQRNWEKRERIRIARQDAKSGAQKQKTSGASDTSSGVTASATSLSKSASARRREKRKRAAIQSSQTPPTAMHPAAAATASSAAASSAASAHLLPLSPPPSHSPPAFSPPSWQLLYDPDAIDAQLRPMLCEKVLGIDVEWRPTFVSGQPPNRVALVQVSSSTRCVLVPVRHLRRVPPCLAQLLASEQIWKVGCGVGEDARKLEQDYKLECRSTLEIGEVRKLEPKPKRKSAKPAEPEPRSRASNPSANASDPSRTSSLTSTVDRHCTLVPSRSQVAMRLQYAEGVCFPALAVDERVRPGLAGLALACGYQLSKPKSISRSNWERRPLTPQQQRSARHRPHTQARV